MFTFPVEFGVPVAHSVMSCADEEGCFTFTWEIENFDIFLRTEKGQLSSPAWKTETTEGKAVEWQVLASHIGIGPSISFRLICLNETWNPDRCESSAISSCGKILPTHPKISVLHPVHFTIYKIDMFVNKMQSNIPLNGITVECKMWRNSMKGGGLRIHSVVKKVLFCEYIVDPHFFSPRSSPYSSNKIIEKDNVRINMGLDSKVGYDSCICALTLRIIDGCSSLVYCNFVCDYIMAKKRLKGKDTKYNDLRTEYKEMWVIVKQSEASCKIALQLDTIVAHHSNCHDQITHTTASPIAKTGGSSKPTIVVPHISNSQYKITPPTSFPIAKTGGSSEAVNDPLKDLLRLYKEGVLSDVTINTEEKSFSAHRSILAARSPVFRAMFEKDEMSESRTGVVDIDDVDSETVERMLVFLYGDSLQDLQWGEAALLYYAADKYAVQPLKQKCADILQAGLTVDNVCDALVLADKHSDEHLMKCAVDFIYDHQEVVSSPKFEQLEDINLRLTSKVMKELFLKRGKQ